MARKRIRFEFDEAGPDPIWSSKMSQSFSSRDPFRFSVNLNRGNRLIGIAGRLDRELPEVVDHGDIRWCVVRTGFLKIGFRQLYPGARVSLSECPPGRCRQHNRETRYDGSKDMRFLHQHDDTPQVVYLASDVLRVGTDHIDGHYADQ